MHQFQKMAKKIIEIQLERLRTFKNYPFIEEGQISPSTQSFRRRSLHVPFRTAPIR